MEPEDGGDPVELFNLPGGQMLFQRDKSVFAKPHFNASQDLSYDLEVTPDGNTAVLTMRLESPIMMGHAANEDEGFGTIQFAQKLTIDLTPDVPVVTDVKISQYINS